MAKTSEQILKSRVHVGVKAQEPMQRMIRSADRRNSEWVGIWPWEFHCVACGTTWGEWAISVGCDLGTVSCSNCYSDDVVLTAIKIEVPAPVDVSHG